MRPALLALVFAAVAFAQYTPPNAVVQSGSGVGGAGNLTTANSVVCVSAAGVVTECPTTGGFYSTVTGVGSGTTTPAAQIDILAAPSTVGLNLNGNQLSGSGTTAASAIVNALGATGQSSSNPGGTAGVGGAYILLGGSGGDKSAIASANVAAGRGGAGNISGGAGGNSTGGSTSTAKGGAGGAINISSGVGGTANGTGSGANGGAGGAIALIAGTGGAQLAGTKNGGFGGSITITAGTGGADSSGGGGANGNGGSLTLDAGVSGAGSGTVPANGTISIGTTNASSISIGHSSSGFVTNIIVPKISPQSADPTCAGVGDIGKLWIDNTSAVTTHFKVCAEVASTPTWVSVF